MTKYILTDSFGRSYFEGRTFTREEAIIEARQISERPHGVWLVEADSDDAGEELFPAA